MALKTRKLWPDAADMRGGKRMGIKLYISYIPVSYTHLDYSIVILLITLAIRIVVLPLDIKQRKNTRMMANLGPEMESLKKRYANNPDQMNRKMQELYRERNVKPMAGCLPMILQLFLLFAFFGALRNIVSEQTVSLVLRAAHDGVENVQLPQWLWVHNLWQPDSGLAGCMPSAAEFLTFLQTNAGSITPQTMVMLQNHGLITYSGGTLQVATEAYNTPVSYTHLKRPLPPGG